MLLFKTTPLLLQSEKIGYKIINYGKSMSGYRKKANCR